MRWLIGKGLHARITPAASGSSKAAVALARRWRRRLPRGWRALAVVAAVLGVGGGLGVAAYSLARAGALFTLAGKAENDFVAASANLGLAIDDVEVEGRAMTSREAILQAIGAERGTPILAISPAQARAQLEALPWVRQATVERRLPDTLHIRLVERTPLAFWQQKGKLVLIDRDGVVITGDRLDRFPGLIVTVGADAPRHAASLLDMLATEPVLVGRVVAAVRVGGRRWDLHLDNGIDVQLPEEHAAQAWAQLAQLERTSRLLARDVQLVDMRVSDRLIVRVTPEPPKEPAKKGRQGAKNT